MDIDNILAAKEPLVTCKAVNNQFVHLEIVSQGHSRECFPCAVALTHSKGIGAMGNQNPEVTLSVKGHGAGIETAITARSVGHQGPTGIGGIIESAYLVVAHRDHSAAPQGGHHLVGVAGVDSGIGDVVFTREETRIAHVQRPPRASFGSEQVGGQIGIGIGRSMSTRTEHHAVVEGA